MADSVGRVIENELSSDINVITAEINAYQRVAGEAIFEIGRRLKSVRDNPEEYGFEGYRDWELWCENELNMKRAHANRFIRVFERFGQESPGIPISTSITVSYLLTSFTDEELEQTYELPSGESKKPTEMSRREIEELKKALKEAEKREELERRERERLEEENEQLAKEADKPAEVRYETKTEYIEVDNTPDDYEAVKARLEEYRNKFGDLENYDEHITATHRQDMIVAIMSYSQGVREFIKRYSYMTEYKGVIDNLDAGSRQHYDEAVSALKGLAESFEFSTEGNNVIDADFREII